MFKYSLLLAAVMSFGLLAGQTKDKDDNLVYRWVDAKGNVHFSQTPPPGQKATSLEVDAPKPSSTPPAPIAPPEPKKEDKLDPSLAKLKGQLKEACDRARENLKTLTTFDRVRMVDEKGEYHLLSDEDKAAQVKQYQQQIKDACKQ
ncbi:DUF4124 domain-containing protein [Gallaecimonas kandeliae]|uniref:DUF4124 domain-containing protein n=1 Tax=Gallaecimonas kandeliae TaxID=3029055 RepID=UPI002648C98D|nr:DUF4124 domain-containing protein [Gallaecimonas kandeliae]WKE64943.1 DUF4124 domain-containing protein [Gallaecimonas kandeliae]